MWGIHHCLGSVLASLEGRVVFDPMLKPFTSIELLQKEPPMQPGVDGHARWSAWFGLIRAEAPGQPRSFAAESWHPW